MREVEYVDWDVVFVQEVTNIILPWTIMSIQFIWLI